MQLLPVAHFFHSLLGGCNSKATANPPKSVFKKWATGQSCIRKRSTTCIIGTLTQCHSSCGFKIRNTRNKHHCNFFLSGPFFGQILSTSAVVPIFLEYSFIRTQIFRKQTILKVGFQILVNFYPTQSLPVKIKKKVFQINLHFSGSEVCTKSRILLLAILSEKVSKVKCKKNRFMTKPFQTNNKWLIGGKATARQTKFILHVLEGKLTFLDTSSTDYRHTKAKYLISKRNQPEMSN